MRPSIEDAIGRTPLIALQRMTAGLPGRVAIKLESRNPTGSVKDRVASALVSEAEQDGRLQSGGTIVAATSGNTGLALAQIANARGYKAKLTIPGDWAHERLALLLHLGADVIVTPGGGMKAARDRARSIATSSPDVTLLDQFESPANPEIHRRTTAEEIWDDTRGEIAAFVAGVGSGGTIIGVARGLRSHGGHVRIVAVEPASSAVLSGLPPGSHAIQGLGAGFVPPLFQEALVDEIITMSDDDAFTGARSVARSEGILVGVSSGATVRAALAIAARPAMAGKLVVAMACDSAEPYIIAPRLESLARAGRR
ncbi:MAG: cysteine synthase family protein [Polyangiaceae bacterium]